MEREMNGIEIGQQLGVESAEATITKVEAYCDHERKRIELANQAKIVAIKAEFSLLLEEEQELRDRLRHAPPPGDLRIRKRKAIYYWAVTLVLTAAGVFFTLYAFEPFRLGSYAYLYCLGIAAAAPFLIELALDKWNGGRLVKTLAGTACASAIIGLMLLAVIRGDLLAQRLVNSEPVIILDDAQPVTPQPQTDFYRTTLAPLMAVMVLLAMAMDLGAGLALHEAWRMGSDSTDDWKKLRKQMKELLQRKIALAHDATKLKDEPEVFVEGFWSNYYRAALTHVSRSAMAKLLLVAVAFSLLTVRSAVAESQLDLVIAVDLTQSVAIQAPGQPSEFQKNIEAVTKVLAQVPASSRVTIIGITDQSFAQPDILLSATVPDDPGYFRERLTAARNGLVRAWKSRSRKVQPIFPHTDILGALLLASQILTEQSTARQKDLIIFSDMRNSTPDLNMDTPSGIAQFSRALTHRRAPVADLWDIEVYVLGVDAADRSIGYWQTLRDSWTLYFKDAGAELRSFTVLRETPRPQIQP